MSTATELAELDAAIAERELTDDAADRLRELVQEGAPVAQALEQLAQELDDADETKRPPAPAEPASGEPTEKQLRALDRETSRHLESVHRIMGGFVEGFTPCEKCDGLGLMEPGPEPQAHPYFKTCETCAGYGQVLTGSLREGRNARDCPECGGNGYLEALNDQGVPLADGGGPAPVSPLPSPLPAAGLEPANGGGAAPAVTFGRPAWMGDPNIGA